MPMKQKRKVGDLDYKMLICNNYKMFLMWIGKNKSDSLKIFNKKIGESKTFLYLCSPK